MPFVATAVCLRQMHAYFMLFLTHGMWTRYSDAWMMNFIASFEVRQKSTGSTSDTDVPADETMKHTITTKAANPFATTMLHSIISFSTILLLILLLLLSHDCHSFVSQLPISVLTATQQEQTSGSPYTHHHQLLAVPPQSPWDELKSRLGGANGSSEKYSEAKAGIDYRPTYEIKDGDDDPELSMNEQRIESGKALVLGALVGSISVAPLTYFHYSDYSMPQFELATDMAAIQAGLFAITYRYVSRKGDNNPMLSQGAVGAFAIVRTLSNIQASTSCSAFPLTCKWLLQYSEVTARLDTDIISFAHPI